MARAAKRAEVSPSDELPDFEGEPVEAMAIEIPGAAGGLQDALAFDPILIKRGDIVYCVLRLRCDKVRFEPIPKKTTLRRVGVMTPVDEHGDPGGGMFVDAEFVEEKLAEHNEQVRIAKEQKAGIFRLDASGDDGDGDGEGGGEGDGEE